MYIAKIHYRNHTPFYITQSVFKDHPPISLESIKIL